MAQFQLPAVQSVAPQTKRLIRRGQEVRRPTRFAVHVHGVEAVGRGGSVANRIRDWTDGRKRSMLSHAAKSTTCISTFHWVRDKSDPFAGRNAEKQEAERC